MVNLPRSILNLVLPNQVQNALQRTNLAKWQKLQTATYCWRCGVDMNPSAVTQKGCSFCIDQKIQWDHLRRVCCYEPPISDWIVNMKFHGQWTWLNYLAPLLAEQIKPHLACEKNILCPVPMHPLRRWRRGYNQSHLLAVRLKKHLNLPMIQALKRVRYTPPQVHVTMAQRPKNIRGSIVCKPIDFAGWHVWLIDDVKTTGATLNTCAQILRQAGAASINVAVLAATDPSHHSFCKA